MMTDIPTVMARGWSAAVVSATSREGGGDTKRDMKTPGPAGPFSPLKRGEVSGETPSHFLLVMSVDFTGKIWKKVTTVGYEPSGVISPLSGHPRASQSGGGRGDLYLGAKNAPMSLGASERGSVRQQVGLSRRTGRERGVSRPGSRAGGLREDRS